jgi:glutamate decarboxylase
MDDLRDAIAHLHRHPVTVPVTAEESSGFNHL